MERILERYERDSYADRQLVAPDLEPQGTWTLEHAKLKARLGVLQRNERHFMGEELDSLSLKELQNLERQLESARKHIRSKKNQLMNESISELQKTVRYCSVCGFASSAKPFYFYNFDQLQSLEEGLRLLLNAVIFQKFDNIYASSTRSGVH